METDELYIKPSVCWSSRDCPDKLICDVYSKNCRPRRMPKKRSIEELQSECIKRNIPIKYEYPYHRLMKDADKNVQSLRHCMRQRYRTPEDVIHKDALLQKYLARRSQVTYSSPRPRETEDSSNEENYRILERALQKLRRPKKKANLPKGRTDVNDAAPLLRNKTPVSVLEEPNLQANVTNAVVTPLPVRDVQQVALPRNETNPKPNPKTPIVVEINEPNGIEKNKASVREQEAFTVPEQHQHIPFALADVLYDPVVELQRSNGNRQISNDQPAPRRPTSADINNLPIEAQRLVKLGMAIPQAIIRANTGAVQVIQVAAPNVNLGVPARKKPKQAMQRSQKENALQAGIISVLKGGELIVIDVEGEEFGEQELQITKDDSIGYVAAGWVTRIDAGKVYVRFLVGNGSSSQLLSSPYLKLEDTPTELDGSLHIDTLLYHKVWPMNSTVVPPEVVAEVVNEYSFTQKESSAPLTKSKTPTEEVLILVTGANGDDKDPDNLAVMVDNYVAGYVQVMVVKKQNRNRFTGFMVRNPDGDHVSFTSKRLMIQKQKEVTITATPGTRLFLKKVLYEKGRLPDEVINAIMDDLV